MEKRQAFQNTLSKLGDSWEVPEDLFADLEAFTCAIYGKDRHKSVDEVRNINIRAKCMSSTNTFDPKRNVDISMLPPCQKSLQQHIRRVNYQVGIWKAAHISRPSIPDASDNHGWHVAEGVLQPKQFEADFIPQQLAEILVHEVTEDDESEDETMDDVLFSLYDSDAIESEDDED